MKVNTEREMARPRDKSARRRSLAATAAARPSSPEASTDAALNCDLEQRAGCKLEAARAHLGAHSKTSTFSTRTLELRANESTIKSQRQQQLERKAEKLVNLVARNQLAACKGRSSRALTLLLFVTAVSCATLAREPLEKLAGEWLHSQQPIEGPNCDTHQASDCIQPAHQQGHQLATRKSPIVLFASAEATASQPMSNQLQDEDMLRVKFVQRPPAVVRVHEGHVAVLRCQTEHNFPNRAWLKGLNGPLFRDTDFQNVTRSIKTAHRVKFIGDLSTNDYSIEINNVIPADEDEYTCQAMPLLEHEIGDPRFWEATTRLEVIPTPTLTMPPSTEALNSLTTVQEHHQYSPTSRHQSASLESAAPTDTFGSPSSKSPSNNNRAREVQPSARELDRNNQIGAFISPASSAFSSNYNGNHHATVRAATVYPSVAGPHSAGLASAALFWPYLLLLLAALLMVANIYLIVQLIRKHTRCVKEQEANEDHDDDPSSMA